MIARWSLRILLALFLALVVSTGFGYWMATRTSLLEEQVNAWLDSFLSSQWPVAVSIGDIGGEPWRLLRLTDIRVDEIRGDSLLPLLTVDTLEVEYVWRQLAGRQWRLERALLAGVKGRFAPASDGTSLWRRAPDTAASGPLRLPQVKIDQLELRRFEASLLARDTLRASLEKLVGALEIGADRISVDARLAGLGVEAHDTLYMDTLGARLVGFGREWFAEPLLFVFDSTRAEGTAHVQFDSTFRARATLALDPVRWNDLSRWIEADLPGGGKLSVEVSYADGTVSGRGTVQGEVLSRKLEALGVSFHVESGVIHFDTLFGRALGASVAGRGRLDASVRPITYGLRAHMGGFDLRHLVPGALPSQLHGYFDVAGHGTARAELRVDVVADSAWGSLGEIEFSGATGALSVTSDSLYLHPAFQARYLECDLVFGGALKFTDRMAVSGDVRAQQIGRLVERLGFPGARGEARGRFVLSEQTTDPTLTFDIELDSVSYKMLSAERSRLFARLARAFREPTGRVSGRAWPLDVGGLLLDSASWAIDWSPAWLRFDSVAAYRQEDALHAEAAFDPSSRNLTLDSLEATVLGRPVRSPWPAELHVGAETLYVHNLTLTQDSGSVSTNGWLEYGDELRLTTVAADARIGPWLQLFYPASSIDGKLFAELKLGGRTEAPELDFRMRLQGSEYERFLLGDVTAAGRLSHDALRFDSILLLSGDGVYRASGVIPLASGSGVWRPLRTGPLSGQVEVEGQGLRMASLVLPEVESLYGKVQGSLTIGGSLDDPQFSGRFVLAHGDLKSWSLREHFAPAHVEITLDDSIATLRDVRLRVRGETRDVVLSGRLIFHGLTDVEYDLAARGTDVPLSYEYADFTGRFDLDLTARGQGIPQVAGGITVREAHYGDPLEAMDSLARVAEQVAPDTTAWNLNLDVDIPNNAWVKNDDVNAELSGALRVIRQRGQWNYLGSLEPLRGSYYLYGRKFRNLRGSIVFDDVHEVDPVLDLEADVNLPFTDSSGGTDATVLTYHEVTVQVQGRLSEPQIIPPASMGESQFIRALYPLDDPESAAHAGSGFITGEIERLGTRTLGVETFELRPSESGRYDWSDARLRVGTYLLPDVYVYGGSSVDPSEGQEVGFEYRLKNWLRLQGHRSYDNLFQFDLNFKWEADK